MGEFAKGYANVGSVTLVGGDTAGTHIARELAAGLTATFGSVKAATGVDLARLLQGRAIGRGIAQGADAVTDAATALRRAGKICTRTGLMGSSTGFSSTSRR